MTSAEVLKSVRQIHNYIGVFFAPTILFFAITGGLQMFGLHESTRGKPYVPPAFLTHLSQLHKKGTLYLPPPRSNAPAPAKADKSDKPKQDGQASEKPAPQPAAPQPAAPAHPSPLPIKIFFAATALALLTSTCTGIFMAWKYARRKLTVLLVLGAGVVVPIALLFL